VQLLDHLYYPLKVISKVRLYQTLSPIIGDLPIFTVLNTIHLTVTKQPWKKKFTKAFEKGD
jgi:hypothetical protein